MTQAPNEEPDFEQALADVERSLQLLKERYAQVLADEQRKADLQTQERSLKARLRSGKSKALHQELKQIQQQLDEVEIALESRLFSWQGAREIFWQALRFGGIGIVMGWILKSLT
jgi:phage terminase Nu1 subunit (DNA packaging protein)